ncbi:MAG: DnaJ domain-containing protein [Promethearchaeota archaeon]
MESDSDHQQNHYKLLNVSVDASSEMVYSAYRKLARKHHPDKVLHRARSTPDSLGLKSVHKAKKRKRDTLESVGGMFQLICEAKDILTDTEKRLAYNLKVFGDEKSKWIGSEARALEDIFYHDMNTSTSKSHTEKLPPIVLRKDITLAEWIENTTPLTIEYERDEVCPSCYGYQRVPYITPTNESAFRFYTADWDHIVYTVECTACTGEGFLVKDSSLEAKMKHDGDDATMEQTAKINHSTPVGYSTTITAEIHSCLKCEGRKRVFREDASVKFKTDECGDCKSTGTRYNPKVSLEIPFPRHFDADTLTSVIVLMDQGHQQRANQVPGDIHVIVQLKIPKQSMTLIEPAFPPKDKFVIPPVERREEEEEEKEEKGTEEKGTEDDLCEEKQTLEDTIETDIPMELTVSKGGRGFTTNCSISLKQAICGFTLRIPCYWKTPIRMMGGYISSPGSKSIKMSQGEYTWTGDVWNVASVGPAVCNLCSMPSFIWASNASSRHTGFNFACTGEKLMGKYPGFAPCLFARLQETKNGHHDNGNLRTKEGTKAKWVFYGCGVSRQRYPSYPGNTLVSLHHPLHMDDSTPGCKTTFGSLQVTFNMDAPMSHMENPDMFYRTFAWCCSKLAGCRPPTIRGT